MDEPIIGSRAIATGELTRGELRWNYRRIYPDVYVHKNRRLDVFTRANAAWLWTDRAGILAGHTAAALHGAKRAEAAPDIELIGKRRRARPGVVIRNERIEDDEITPYGRMRLTSPARTALDLARQLPAEEAVVHLDQLCAATRLTVGDVMAIQQRYRGARGMGTALEAIRVMDGGARSPQESVIRLRLVEAGLPRPQTSIPITEGWWNDRLGMGWPRYRVGVEWGGHRRSLDDDVRFRDLLRREDWQLIEALPDQQWSHLLRECREALRRRRRRGS
ncbi:hypothetical protein ACQI4F_09305 [Mycolicibacterium vaccae]|uniref:hypothetical protein n=1 Tax=Mycolicibacterium vaccae TaxID=1810 RepID=UPI003CF88567